MGDALFQDRLFQSLAQDRLNRGLPRDQPNIDLAVDQYLWDRQMELEDLRAGLGNESAEEFKLIEEVGQNLFRRCYYTIEDTTSYLNLWKYWIQSNHLFYDRQMIEYLWDFVFI